MRHHVAPEVRRGRDCRAGTRSGRPLRVDVRHPFTMHDDMLLRWLNADRGTRSQCCRSRCQGPSVGQEVRTEAIRVLGCKGMPPGTSAWRGRSRSRPGRAHRHRPPRTPTGRVPGLGLMRRSSLRRWRCSRILARQLRLRRRGWNWCFRRCRRTTTRLLLMVFHLAGAQILDLLDQVGDVEALGGPLPQETRLFLDPQVKITLVERLTFVGRRDSARAMCLPLSVIELLP